MPSCSHGVGWHNGAVELPWVVETRVVGGRVRRNPVWGILALLAASLCGLMLLLAMGATAVDLSDAVVWLLPIWGVVTLLGLGMAITAVAKRGAANITMAAIAGGLIVVSNPVIFLVIAMATGRLD